MILSLGSTTIIRLLIAKGKGGKDMKTIIYAILFVIVAPFWWLIMQIDSVVTKLYMHISIKLMECRLNSNDNDE